MLLREIRDTRNGNAQTIDGSARFALIDGGSGFLALHGFAVKRVKGIRVWQRYNYLPYVLLQVEKFLQGYIVPFQGYSVLFEHSSMSLHS